MSVVPLFTATLGLNAGVSEDRVPYTETGLQYLSTAVNVDINSGGSISRRKGYAQVLAAAGAHSIFAMKGGNLLYVRNKVLYLLFPDGTTTQLMELSTDDRMYYAQVLDVYCSNGTDRVIIEQEAVASAWVVPGFSGPQTSRTFSPPRPGKFLLVFAGRLWLAAGQLVYFSEPGSPRRFDLSSGFLQFPEEVTMLAAVESGLFVGTASGVTWVNGSDPEKMEPTIVLQERPIKDSNVSATSAVIAGIRDNPYYSGTVQLFLTRSGLWCGTKAGSVIRVSDNRLPLPEASGGCAVVFGNRYICSLQP